MLESAWLFVGFVGVLSTGTALTTNDNGMAMVTGCLGFVSWAIWSYGALTVEVASQGSVLEFAMPSLTFVGTAFALLPLYIALTGPVELIGRHTDATLDDL